MRRVLLFSSSDNTFLASANTFTRSFQGAAEDLIKAGWSISPKKLTEYLKQTEHGSNNEVVSCLLNTDLNEFGTPWIADSRKPDTLEASGRIVQVTRVRNIAISQAEEEMDTSGSSSGGPRLLRITLTDGHTTMSSLDIDNHEKLSMNTPPGTKIQLLGTISVSLGFLILRKNQINVLGGHVENLIREWTMTKLAKGCDGRFKNGTGGAPPFVPFGSSEAVKLVQRECKFLSSLRIERNAEKAPFDSFKIATGSGEAEKENEYDASFHERRKGVIAEVRESGANSASYGVTRSNMPVSSRFLAGGSRFADLQAEKAQAHDEALAQLLSMGYPLPLASSALKIFNGDLKAATDHLLAKSMSNASFDGKRGGRAPSGPSRSRGGRRGRGRGGRFGYDPEEEDDPRFDPAAAAAAAGLPSRPSGGLTRLDDLIPSAQPQPDSSTSSSKPGTSGSKSVRLPIGCPIMAQNMAGEYEEAHLIGLINSPGADSNVNGSSDKVVLVVYSRSNNGPTEEEEELVPLSLIRTLNKERITLTMVPPAPYERAKPYSLPVGSTNNTGDVNSPDMKAYGNRYVNDLSSRGFLGARGRGFSRRGFSSGRRGRGRRPRF